MDNLTLLTKTAPAGTTHICTTGVVCYYKNITPTQHDYCYNITQGWRTNPGAPLHNVEVVS